MDTSRILTITAIDYTVEETSFTFGGITYNVTKDGSAYTVTADSNSVAEGETVGTWQTTVSGITFTNELFGSVKVTKSFSGVTELPENFQITAEWGPEGSKQSISLNILTTGDGYTGTLPTGVTVERTNTNAGEETPASYTWTISNLPMETVVTFTEENYNVAGYNVTATITPNNGQATADVTPGEVTITNTYTPGVELPATGGPGTMIYTLTGTLLIWLAAIMLVSRKRRNRE